MPNFNFLNNDNVLDTISKTIDDRIQSALPVVASEQEKHDLAVKHTEALASLAQSVGLLSAFVTGGGLAEILSGVARSQSVTAILGGLAAHGGRNALDARLVDQNALEIVHHIEAVFGKYHESLTAKRDGEKRDSDIHETVDPAQKAWLERHKKDEP